LILVELGAAWTLFTALLATRRFAWLLGRGLVWGWNALFVLALVLTILPHQIRPPALPGAYPLEAPPVPNLALLPLLVMLALSPVLLVDLLLYIRQLALERPTIRQLGGGFALGALLFLAMVFLHVFTTVYDYAPVIGPVFRDRFWLVHLLAGLGLALPLLWMSGETFELDSPGFPRRLTPLGVGALALLAAVAVPLVAAPKGMPRAADQELRVMTYNIQQGFDAAGNQGLVSQLANIQKVNPDILGLQESDTARVANGSVDSVRYLADRLGMYSYYGPTTTVGTFGIALLSRYPIDDAHTFFMYSAGEQTATIQARLHVGERAYDVFVTHLGNGGPMVQLLDILVRLEAVEGPVILMGDHNFRPDTDQYRLITARLQDSWLLKWPGGTSIPGYSPDRRIDHIFVSPGTVVLDSAYVADPASDHPYLYTVIQP
jgi:endonuclease/exonuclease/phosphatase family metal-dependent hydrolase